MLELASVKAIAPKSFIDVIRTDHSASKWGWRIYAASQERLFRLQNLAFRSGTPALLSGGLGFNSRPRDRES
jgi:hypothetical protein